jgi:hypothetical protein
MGTVVVNIAFTDSPPTFPANTVVSGTVVTLEAPVGAATIPSQTIAPGVTSAAFNDVPAGDGYKATAQAMDSEATPAPLGALMVSDLFNVAAPTVSLALPSAVTVTVS